MQDSTDAQSESQQLTRLSHPLYHGNTASISFTLKNFSLGFPASRPLSTSAASILSQSLISTTRFPDTSRPAPASTRMSGKPCSDACGSGEEDAGDDAAAGWIKWSLMIRDATEKAYCIVDAITPIGPEATHPAL